MKDFFMFYAVRLFLNVLFAILQKYEGLGKI